MKSSETEDNTSSGFDKDIESTEFSVSPSNAESSSGRKLLSTSSPEGIQVAAKITPTRLANLLIKKGPLPIRHITSFLSSEVAGFENLSLSKQRRLIMSAMEQTDKKNDVVFEKIGWGQWAVRRIDSDFIVTEGSEVSDDGFKKQINVHELRKQSGLKLGWTKRASTKSLHRRESITNKQTNPHNIKLPNEAMDGSTTMAIESDSASDYAISDVEESSEDDDSENEELFMFDHDDENKIKLSGENRSPPLKFANRVPLKISPPPNGGIRQRNSASNPSSVTKNAHIHGHSYGHRTILNRSRLNSLENLDNYILSSSKNSNVSVSSPPIPVSNISASPIPSWGSSHDHLLLSNSDNIDNARSVVAGRRKSSFNESNIRSTLSTSLPKHPPDSGPHVSSISSQPTTNGEDGVTRGAIRKSLVSNISDTDEEDWATIGAKSLRDKSADTINAFTKAGPHRPQGQPDNNDERAAAIALVDLMSV